MTAVRVSRMVGCMNPQCKWAGLCGLFFTADVDARELPQAAGAMCQCGCPGAQHVLWEEVKSKFLPVYSLLERRSQAQVPKPPVPPFSVPPAVPPPVPPRATSSKVKSSFSLPISISPLVCRTCGAVLVHNVCPGVHKSCQLSRNSSGGNGGPGGHRHARAEGYTAVVSFSIPADFV